MQKTTNGISCQQLTNNNPIQIDLSNACSEASMIHFCSPVHVSVYSASANGNTQNGYNGNTNGDNINYNGNDNGYNNGYNGNNGYNSNNGNSNGNTGNSNGAVGSNSPIQVTCTDPLCPLPNMIMFNIEVDNLGCYNGSRQLISSSLIVFLFTVIINRFIL